MIPVPWYIRYAPHIGIAIIVGAAFFAVRAGIENIEDAGREAAAAKARVTELEATVAQRDFALEGWVAVKAQWEADQKAAAELQAKQEAELEAARHQAETNRRKYRDAIAQLEEADRACAARTVPAAVDGLLGQRR